MPVTERDKRRLDALIAIVRPAHSLASRVEKLEPSARAQYDHYSERMSAFIARNDIDKDGGRGNAYGMLLRGYGPRLPDAITAALFGSTPIVPITATDDGAARIYKDYCDD